MIVVKFLNKLKNVHSSLHGNNILKKKITHSQGVIFSLLQVAEKTDLGYITEFSFLILSQNKKEFH